MAKDVTNQFRGYTIYYSTRKSHGELQEQKETRQIPHFCIARSEIEALRSFMRTIYPRRTDDEEGHEASITLKAQTLERDREVAIVSGTFFGDVMGLINLKVNQIQECEINKGLSFPPGLELKIFEKE